MVCAQIVSQDPPPSIGSYTYLQSEEWRQYKNILQ